VGNDHSKKNKKQSGDSTRVDLGDDLIGASIIAPRTSESKDKLSGPTTDEQFENAKILANEGFIEDAKKLLRKILISDPKHGPARQHLQQILDREMNDLLADRDTAVKRPQLFERKGKNARTTQITGEEVLRELEQDLGLSDGNRENPVATVQADVKGTSETDRIDLGIAFIEMGLYEQAISHLHAAIELIERSDTPDHLQKISATALLARAFLLAQRPYDAIHLLHAIARDAEIAPQDKVEFFYLMGIAYEQAGDRKAALPWFEKVRDLNPRYRDIQERLRKPIA
jgi:tetratricopeptide (TPR) repeat protein